MWGEKEAPPSVNTMQFFYRLLESQKVQNKRLKRLGNELNVLRCDAFTTSAEGTALTATSWANNILFEVQTSRLQPSKVPSFVVTTSVLLSVLRVFWYTAPWRVVTSHLKTRRHVSRKKTWCCTERAVPSIRHAASMFVLTLWIGTVFSASSNESSYIRISPNSGVKRPKYWQNCIAKRPIYAARFALLQFIFSTRNSWQTCWCIMFHWTCIRICFIHSTMYFDRSIAFSTMRTPQNAF